jgi:hypothetical protein
VRRIVLAAVAATALAAAGSTASAGHLLNGTFTARISGAPSPVLDGSWSLHFGPGGRYTISKNGSTAAVGRATYGNGTIILGHETGPLACTGAQARAVYRWKLTGRTLRLTRRSDPCGGRRLVLARAFTRRR